jgi:hypothetical protein
MNLTIAAVPQTSLRGYLLQVYLTPFQSAFQVAFAIVIVLRPNPQLAALLTYSYGLAGGVVGVVGLDVGRCCWVIFFTSFL